MKNIWQKIKSPFFVLAPMDGVTDVVFRELLAETAKPDILMTEFTNVDSLFSRGKDASLRRLKYSGLQKPVVAQVWGTEPANYEKAAALIAELGLEGIDINMGCPTRSVMKKDSGAALIKNFQLAQDLIQATKLGAAGKIPVSVKTRLGVEEDISETWIPHLLKQKIAALTIHLRTADEQSKVPAQWEKMTKIVQMRDEISPETTIIGNGDVLSRKQGQKLSREYKIEGIMIGRGVFSNPWIFEKIPAEHNEQEYFKLFLRHIELHKKYFGEDHRFWELKKFVKMYVKNSKGSNQLRTELLHIKKFADFEKRIRELIDL